MFCIYKAVKKIDVRLKIKIKISMIRYPWKLYYRDKNLIKIFV